MNPAQAWIRFEGPDAEDFLHRVTTVHVRGLSPGSGARGCFLTAQGRIRAFFHLWRTGESSFAFELDAGPDGAWRTRLLETIEQLTFSERVEVIQGDAIASAWVLSAPAGAEALGEMQTMELDGARICRHADSELGRSLWTVHAPKEKLATWLSEKALLTTNPEELETSRILSLTPRADREITEKTIPLEVGLRDAIAENKGCYPGQEVIEKIISYGSPARRLALIEGEGTPPSIGEHPTHEADDAGEVTSSTPLPGNRFAALALLKKTHAREGLELSLAAGNSGTVKRLSTYA